MVDKKSISIRINWWLFAGFLNHQHYQRLGMATHLLLIAEGLADCPGH